MRSPPASLTPRTWPLPAASRAISISSTLAAEAHFAAERENAGAHLLDHADQAEGADVRLVDVEDLGRRAGLDEFLQHLAPVMLRVLDLTVQLAVGKGAGAALAELHVRVRVEFALAPQAPGVLGAFADDLAALEDDRAKPHLRQQQAGEQAARAGADDQRARRPAGGRLRDETVGGVGRRHDVALAAQPGKRFRFVPDLDVDRVNQRDRRFLARIEAAAENRVADQFVFRDAKALADGGAEGLFGVVERELYFGQS